MKFLCDVHISFKVVNFLRSKGHETLHVNHILDGSRTSDKKIGEYANLNDFIVITKDSDFQNSYFINRIPKKLIKINLGNISNQDLIFFLASVLSDQEKLDNLESFLIEIDKGLITYFTE